MKRLVFCMAVVSLLVLGCDSPPADATYKVIYHGGAGTTGYPPNDNNQYKTGEEATVLDQGALLKTGHTFQNWNTSADGSGTTYAVGEKITIRNITVFLHAQWQQE